MRKMFLQRGVHLELDHVIEGGVPDPFGRVVQNASNGGEVGSDIDDVGFGKRVRRNDVVVRRLLGGCLGAVQIQRKLRSELTTLSSTMRPVRSENKTAYQSPTFSFLCGSPTQTTLATGRPLATPPAPAAG